jgi:hypothetical protein
VTMRESKPGQSNKPILRELTPLFAHRLFPVFAALWFAALFGLGSLAISSSVLGRVVVMTGLPAIIPAAAPPLGFTAHALLALIMAFAGGAIGLAIGLAVQLRLAAEAPAPNFAPPRRAAAPTPQSAAAPVNTPANTDAPKVRARDAHPDAPPRRPLELTDALVADPIPMGAEAAAAQFETPEEEPILLSALAPVELAEPVLAIPAPEPTAPVAAPLQTAATSMVHAAGLKPGEAPARKLLADLPLDGLGTLQLIERLALALDTRRPGDRAALDGSDPAVSQPSPELAAPASVLPLGALTERYASLLAAAPLSQADPVLRFPSETVHNGLAELRPQPRAQFASPDEADAALRSALATLKRMASQG